MNLNCISKPGGVALLCMVLCCRVSAQSSGATDTNTLNLDAVISEVLSNNASLKAARANWEAMKQRVPQARAWEDPKVGFDSTVARFVDMPPNAMIDPRLWGEQTL